MGAKLGSQFRALLPTLFATYLPGFLVLFTLGILKLRAGIPIEALTDDPLAYAKVPAYVGLLSNLGVLFWSFSAAICLFSYVVATRRKILDDRRGFILFSGLLMLMLLLDDLFLLHETLIIYAHVPEALIFLGYAAVILVYLVRYGSVISETDFIFLFFAFTLFGISTGVDIADIHPRGGTLLEEGSKFLGIISLCSYYLRVCLKELSINESDRPHFNHARGRVGVER